MCDSRSFRTQRLCVELLESRAQPGAALTALDPSLVAGTFLGSNLLTGTLPEFASAPQQVTRPTTGPSCTAANFPVDPEVPPRPTDQPHASEAMNPVLNQALADPLVVVPGLGLGNAQADAGDGGSGPMIPDTVLYYGGDCDHRNGLTNEFNTFIADAQTYDNFTVPDGQTWKITGMFSHDYLNFTGVSGANWEIRQGITDGDGGTLIASGTADPATQTPDGCNDFGLTGYEIRVFPSLPPAIRLPAGTYYVNVTPIGPGPGNGNRAFIETTTSGGPTQVGINTPGDTWFNSDFYSQYYDAHWIPTTDEHLELGEGPWNFSSGVIGKSI